MIYVPMFLDRKRYREFYPAGGFEAVSGGLDQRAPSLVRYPPRLLSLKRPSAVDPSILPPAQMIHCQSSRINNRGSAVNRIQRGNRLETG